MSVGQEWMKIMRAKAVSGARFHYAWAIAAATFIVLLVTAAARATPSILMVPLMEEFRWSTESISIAIAINIALFGLIGPFAAYLMNRFGVRCLTLFALTLLALAVLLTTQMKAQWQLILLWGFCVGSATGVTSMVLAVVVSNTWFDARRSLVLGFMTAANATGQLLFLPLLARRVETAGWRSASWIVAVFAVLVGAVIFAVMRDRPEDVGLKPYGWHASDELGTAKTSLPPLAALWLALKSPAFWVLAGSFFICGASTNGLIGTHLIAACHDVGISQVRAAGLLATMGIFDIVGTTASGWLTDRLSSRYLLFMYYSLRGLSLIFLPHTLAATGDALKWFAVFYGLDWVATVPPTVKLTTVAFGRENAAVAYGWIGASHQLGASMAALTAGVVRTSSGTYTPAFWLVGTICFATGSVFLFGAKSLDRGTNHRTIDPGR